MKAHKIVLMVIENERVPVQSIVDRLEETKHVYPVAIETESVDIGEWHDDHPLIQRENWRREFNKLFNSRFLKGLEDIRKRASGDGNPKWIADHAQNLIEGREYDDFGS